MVRIAQPLEYDDSILQAQFGDRCFLDTKTWYEPDIGSQ